MKKFLLTSFCIAMLSYAWAQERIVSGKVTSSEDGSPLPGVNVLLKGTATGTVTNVTGEFSITVPQEGGSLVFSFIGLISQEVEIGARSTIDVSMANDVKQLSEVVVTALNISREKASLGYATQSLDNQSVSTAKEQNFINSLSGKVAGLQIRTNNNFAGSSNIVIRGNNSVTGNNQPLFVVDGVPIDNRTGNSIYQKDGRYGYDYGNAASDINPEDIESINVLKGASASALYGSRASNGVVMITTKKGKARKGVGISVSSGVTVGTINKETFIKYQDKYGAGYAMPAYDYYGPQGFFEDDVDGDGTVDLVVPTLEDGSYGAPFDPNLNVYHWDSFVPESPNFGKAYPWMAAKHTPVDFFESQVVFNNSVAFSGGNDISSFRINYTNYKMDGMLPNQTLQRHSINLSGSTKINEKLNAAMNVNYVQNETVGRASTGYGENQMANFRQWWETNVDVKSLESMFKKTGRNITWNGGDYYDPETPIFWDNPYWTRYKNYQSDERGRLYGNIALTYKPMEWLDVMGRVSLDNYSELREERRAVGSVPTEFGLPVAGARLDEGSGYQREDRRVKEMNYDLILTAHKNLSTDLSLTGILGTNIRREEYGSILSSTLGGLVIPNLYSLNNSALPPVFPDEESLVKEVYGVFANVNLGYKSMLYLDLMGRNDVSSALPVNNNSYFYHSEALSFVFSELVDLPLLDYGKVRLNYAVVGNDTDAGRTTVTYTRDSNFGSAALYSFPTYLNNPNLKPEELKSLEAGLELTGIDNRLKLDLAFYKTNAFNQIVEVEVSKASGRHFIYLNGGEIENRGVETILSYDIIRNNGFTWNTSVNWAKNVSEVKSLPSGIENYQINSYQGGISANATKGEPYGVLRGTGFEYLNGRRVVNEDGFYVAVADQVIANPNPDWTGGWSNTLSYKNMSLSFLVDVSQGGQMYSLDMHYGQGTGLPDFTGGLNELGNPIRNPLTEGEDSGGILLDGVQADGSENTVRAWADAYDGIYYWGNASRNPAALTVYDASYVKLREVAITFTLPETILNTVFQKASLSLVGRNLWIISKHVPYADPESGLGAGNSQGYLSGSFPTLRTYGVKLDLNF